MTERWPYTGGEIHAGDGERFPVDGCPEHGDICDRHVEINGELVQILRDMRGTLSPEHYTIGRLHQRVWDLQTILKRTEDDLDRSHREHEVDKSALAAYRMADQTGRPLRECLLDASQLKPDFLVYFNEDGTVRETAPWPGRDAA